MGTWGTGNFDSDAALDIAGAIADIIDPEIDGFAQSDEVSVEDLDDIMACIAIKNALAQLGALSPIDKEHVVALREKVLAIYDEEIDDLEPEPDYKEERRLVIEQTLNEALTLANQRDND